MTARILFPFVGDSVGGSHLATLTVIENLDPTRFVPVVALDRDGPMADLLASRRIPYNVAPVGNLAGESPNPIAILTATILAYPKIGRALSELSIDVVHTNDLRCHLTWGPATRLSGRPWVWHLHQILGSSRAWTLIGLMASAVLAVSPAAASSGPTKGGRPPVVVPNPFVFAPAPDRGQARAALAAELGIDPARPIVGYVGNMTRQKRPMIFAEVARAISEKSGRKPFFVLIGDDRGGERQAVEDRFAQAGISGQTKFLGYRHPLETTLAGFDLLIAPGIGDSFGRTLVEALSVGTAVAASASGGHGFILVPGETGLLFRPDDVDDATRAVLRLLEDPGLRDGTARAGQREMRSRFAAAAILPEIMRVYDRVLSS